MFSNFGTFQEEFGILVKKKYSGKFMSTHNYNNLGKYYFIIVHLMKFLCAFSDNYSQL